MNRELINTNEHERVGADAAATIRAVEKAQPSRVTQICNLLYRGFATCRAHTIPGASGSPRYVVDLLLCSMLLLAPTPAMAHDPYEITSDVRLETNRTVVDIEMELAAAMLLAGVEKPGAATEPAAMFAMALPELRRQAAQFFVISSATGPMTATQTNVELGVENHVKFNLHYPAATRLRISAAGLKRFGEQSPFGTSVTVLDMVNMKVLGQSVLFADSPAAEFAPAATAEAAATVQSHSATPATNPVAATQPQSTPAPPAPATCCNGRWVLLVTGVIGVISIWLLRKR